MIHLCVQGIYTGLTLVAKYMSGASSLCEMLGSCSITFFLIYMPNTEWAVVHPASDRLHNLVILHLKSDTHYRLHFLMAITTGFAWSFTKPWAFHCTIYKGIPSHCRPSYIYNSLSLQDLVLGSQNIIRVYLCPMIIELR